MTDVARFAGSAILGLALLAACHRHDPLPVLGTVPPFTLVSAAGTSVTADDLRGHVWVVDFVFTRCPDMCPALTQRMHDVRRQLPAGPEGVRVVSITVDPVHDTPDVLRAYAAAHDAAGPDWLFLGGSRDAVVALLRDGFKVAWADDGPPDAPITHSDRFVLVDRELRIRGYYRGTEPESLDRLVEAAERLQSGSA